LVIQQPEHAGLLFWCTYGASPFTLGFFFSYLGICIWDSTQPTINGFDDVLTPTLEARRLIHRPSILVSYGQHHHPLCLCHALRYLVAHGRLLAKGFWGKGLQQVVNLAVLAPFTSS
jgi:hypothetical protein